jgi:enoyl-CoA hydratase
MTYTCIETKISGAIAHLEFNRPARLNAFDNELMRETLDAVAALNGDENVRVIVVSGNGRAFSAGFDLKAASERSLTTRNEWRRQLELQFDFIMCFWESKVPTIAAVHGYCLAGATQLCVFTDITVVAEDAQIGLPALPMGGGYITPLWTPLVGPKRAKQMSFVANSKISGTTAVEWGWANYAVPADELIDNVTALATEIAKIPSPILRVKKMAINRVWDVMGFRVIAPMGAESDALLHNSGAVRQMSRLISEHGLKGAIAEFESGEWDKG